MEEHLFESQEALRSFDARFFSDTMPASEMWRIFPEFRSRVAYLDIETTGLGPMYGDHITTIVLYDGSRVRHYIHGENLRDFKDDISEYDLLVTYNGKSFDIPFIESYFLMTLPQPQIDLRYVMHSLGYRGGLKGCERQLGIDRGDLDGVDGYFAVLLWRDYQRNGNPRALDTLLAYNAQDTVNLEHLMIAAYNMKIQETPFELSHEIALPQAPPESPFVADLATIEAIKLRTMPQTPAWR